MTISEYYTVQLVIIPVTVCCRQLTIKINKRSRRLSPELYFEVRSLGFSIKFIWVAAFLAPSFASTIQAESICRYGGKTIDLTLELASDVAPFAITVDTAYFDQRFIPRTGTTRDGLLLRMQATDLSPWPRHLRPHQKEGPYMSLLVSHYLAFDVILDRLAKLEAGYKLSDDVDWIDNKGLYGLSRFTDPKRYS